MFDDVWSPSDDLHYARVSNGLAQVKQDLESGDLHPFDAAPMLDELQGKLQAMSQRKQQALQAAGAQHQQQQMAEIAHGQALTQANMQHNAQNFGGTTATHTDPEGNATHFYQESPGVWKPVPNKDVMPDIPDGTAVDPADYMPPAAGIQMGTTKDNGDGTFTQEIINGSKRTEVTYDANGKTLGATGAWEGKPGGQPPQQETGGTSDTQGLAIGISSKDSAELRRQAEGLIPRPQLTGNHLHDAVAINKRNEQVSALAGRLGGDLMRQRITQAADAKKEAALAAKKDEADHSTNWQRSFEHHLSQLQKQNETRVKKWSDKAMELEAKRQADSSHQSAYGRLPKGRQAELAQDQASSVTVTGTSGASSAGAAATTTGSAPTEVPKAPAQAPPEGVSLESLLAEKQRRIQAARPPEKPPGASIRDRGFVR